MKATTDEVLHLLTVAQSLGLEREGCSIALHKVEELQADVKALVNMLDAQFARNNPTEKVVPDWITMAHSLFEAREGKGRSIDEVLRELEAAGVK